MKRKTLFWILGGCIILALTPLIIYFINFGFRSFSNDDSDWVGFGNYIGGTVGPIVSLLSLLILGWITFIVARNSSNESFKQQIILKRMEAYSELSSNFVKFHSYRRKIDAYTQYIVLYQKVTKVNEPKEVLSSLSTLQNHLTELHEFCFSITSFAISYGYLFKYDFGSEEFKALLHAVKKMEEHAIEYESSIFNLDGKASEDLVQVPVDFTKHLSKFYYSIIEEINIKSHL